MSFKTTAVIATTVAALFAAGTVASVAQAQGTIKCTGANACKGQSACKTAGSSCKGMNACKGKGFIQTGSSLECTTLGGRPG
jgi:uncharacterized membrane protein